IFGKWHLGDEDAYLPERRGFDQVLIHGGGGIGQTFPGSCGDAPGNQYHDPVLWNGSRFEKTRGYCTDVFLDRAGDWIADRPAAGKPFFALITPNAPHDPFVIPSEPWAAPYRNRGLSTHAVAYYSMIAHLDAAVGRLMARLDALQLSQDTLVIFQTDNGHSVDGIFNAGMRGMKGTPYEGGTRVPAFWRWPGRLPAGTDCAALTAHIDVFATLASLAGADIHRLHSQVEGRSLVPLLENPQAPWADRMLVTHFGRWEYGEAQAARYRLCAIRDARFKLVNHRELYDLEADPGERQDLSARHPDIVTRLKTAYDAWWSETLPETEANDQALGTYLNPFKQRYWDQFDLPRDPELMSRMDPIWKFVRPRPR
ncbi:MAG: Arylsulfatase precursor, partial [Verrucomicrobiota bacterium]